MASARRSLSPPPDLSGEYRGVPISTVTTNPLNQRPAGEDADIARLAARIREYGPIQPILVCSAAAFLARFPEQGAAVGEADWVTLIGNRRLLGLASGAAGAGR